MRKANIFLAALVLSGLSATAESRPKHRDQEAAFQATQQGRLMPLRSIESRVLPKMRGADYLGPELDSGSGRYRLKFLRGGRVIWVDVDGRTGQILAKTGN